MSRRHAAEKREILPDAKFGDRVVTKFMNNLMIDGKKAVAERIVYNAFERVETRLKKEPVEVFHEALDNIKPSVEVRSRRVGGATYQVQTPVNQKRRQTLAIRWILAAIREKKGRPMHLRLAEELISAFNREGNAMTTRDNVHRMADANKAFAHFAW